jgi:hypothetical protein
MQRDSRNLDRNRGKGHAKAGTGKRVRRVKAAGNSAQGRGHAIKSRPGSKLGMPMSEDADAEEKQPDTQQSDARASAKPKHNVTRNPDVVAGKQSGKKKQTHSTSAKKKTATRNAKKAAKAAPAETKGGKRPEGTKPGRHQGMDASTRRASTTGEAKRRKRTAGGFAGVKRAATTHA